METLNIFLFISFAIVAIFQYVFDTSQEQVSLFCPLKALLTICFCLMYISGATDKIDKLIKLKQKLGNIMLMPPHSLTKMMHALSVCILLVNHINCL